MICSPNDAGPLRRAAETLAAVSLPANIWASFSQRGIGRPGWRDAAPSVDLAPLCESNEEWKPFKPKPQKKKPTGPPPLATTPTLVALLQCVQAPGAAPWTSWRCTLWGDLDTSLFVLDVNNLTCRNVSNTSGRETLRLEVPVCSCRPETGFSMAPHAGGTGEAPC